MSEHDPSVEYQDAEPTPPPASDSGGVSAPAEEPALIFEELTLAQMLRYLVWRPRRTLGMLWDVLTRVPDDSQEGDERRGGGALPPAGEDRPPATVQEWPEDEDETDQAHVAPVRAPVQPVRIGTVPLTILERWTLPLRLAVLALALLLAIRGGSVLYDAATDLEKHASGRTGSTIWFALAGILYLGFEVFASRAWWAEKRAALVRLSGLPAWTPSLWWPRALLALTALTLLLALWGRGHVWLAAALFALAAVWWVWGVTEIPSPPGSLSHQVVGVEEAGGRFTPSPARRERGMVGEGRRGFWGWFEAHLISLLLIPPALLLSAVTLLYNVRRDPTTHEIVDVVFTTGGFAAWVISMVLWMLILALKSPSFPRPFSRRQRRGEGRRPLLKRWWPILVLAAIMALGAYFRLHDLESTPPDMTSDHIEKLLDALKVSDGYRGVFFPNNGGREAFQMYVVSVVANVLGVGFTFDALKLATVIEGLITLPALWWMARQVIGTDTEERRQLGHWVGLALAGLVAISYWHVMLSRLGLRIVLTPLTTALVIGFLARAMRHNRIGDYLALGFTLGAGVYFYQANRMLPILVVAGIALALLGAIRSRREMWRTLGNGIGFTALALTPLLIYEYLSRVLAEYNNTRQAGERLDLFFPLFVMVWFSIVAISVRTRRHDPVLQYGGGLLAVVVVALALYIPMYHYSELYPEHFWNRTRGRIFGEEAFYRPDPVTGVNMPYEPTMREQAERFWKQRAVFVQNYRDALRMYHWQGDGAWISNASVPPRYITERDDYPEGTLPALDALAGGLVILGVMVWGVLLFRTRDPVWWLIPAGVVVMLLPSAMTLAYTIENPSFTRASGTIPPIFLLAALPLGLFGWHLSRVLRRVGGIRIGAAAGLLVIGGLLLVYIRPNWENFFTHYRLHYAYSWKPYHEIAQPMKAFAQGEGSYGNAFMVAYPHWLDHRILGTMAGDIRWPNGLVTREDVFLRVMSNRGTPYQFDPGKPAFFMFSKDDPATGEYLQQTFPGGELAVYTYTYETDHGEQTGEFYVYRVMTTALQ